MSDEPELKRLRDEPGGLEQELLRSAAEDRPLPELQRAAMAAVLSQQRRERQQSARRRVALGAVVALAAGAALFVRAQARSPELAAEPPPSAHPTPVAPPPSASVAPVSPLAPCVPPSVGSGHDPLIDDFEDGDTRLIVTDKRAAYWIVFNDGTGVMQPRTGGVFPADRIPGGRGQSRFGLHTRGGKFSKWGSGLSFELSPRRCYDASAYAGVAFWARGQAQLRVAAKMTQVVAEEFGGSCVKDCFDGHGAERLLTKDWQRYEVRWEELAQSGHGLAVPFDPHSLFGVDFTIPAGRPPFDYWLDDVAFIER